MDRFRILLANSALALLACFLVVGILTKEKSYNKAARYDFNSTVTLSDSLTGLWLYATYLISDSRPIDLVNRDNWNKIAVDGMGKIEKYSSYQLNTILPDSISFRWFSFSEQRFYELHSALPSELMLDWLATHQVAQVCFDFEFQPEGQVLLRLHDGYNRARVYEVPWAAQAKVIGDQPWNPRSSREQDIAWMNYPFFTPCYVHLPNPSATKQIKLTTKLKLQMVNNYFFNPDETGRLETGNNNKNKGMPETIRMKVSDSRGDTTQMLSIQFKVPKEEINSLLTTHPTTPFEFHINLTELDSVQGIYLQAGPQKFPLTRPEIQYRMQN